LRLVETERDWQASDFGADGYESERPMHEVSSPRRRGWGIALAGWALRLGAAAVMVGAAAWVYLSPPRGPTSPAVTTASQPATPLLVVAPNGEAPPVIARTPLPAATPPVPSVDVLVMLIRTALVALDQANATGDYAVLRELAAPDVQDASTPARMSAAFAPLRSGNVDLSAVAIATPSLLSPPVVGADGVLRLAGFFPGAQGQVNFSLAYRLVDGRWLPIGMTVKPPAAVPPRATPLSPKKLPDDAALITLIRATIVALNQANLTGDYAVLRESASAGFRDGNSLDKLGAAFAALRGRRIDLSPVAVIAPRLFKKAAIDDDGYLRLTGYFPSKPEQVNFDLAFKFENGAWKLFGIGVNTSVQVQAPATVAGPSSDPPAPQTSPAAVAP
jgi:hypothetical protein